MKSSLKSRELVVRSPMTGAVVGSVGLDSETSVAACVESAHSAQRDWSALSVAERCRWLDRFRDWLYDHTAEIDELLMHETGKPQAEVGIELASSLGVLRYYRNNAARFLADDTPQPSSLVTAHKRFRVRHVPHGVVGLVSPWNFPVAMFMWDALPALLAGCAVVVKPSEHTPLTTNRIVDGWREIGAPPVFACVNGAGDVGAHLVDLVDYVHFTGSTATGRGIATRAAARLIPYSLELGGNDPALVLDDADLDLATTGIVFNGLLNSGQMCVSVERVYVVDSVYDAFVAKVVAAVAALRTEGSGYERDITGLIVDQQLAIVERHVKDAVAKGARVEVGGRRGAGNHFEPTVLTDVDHSMIVMREETFGPVLPIMRVADAEEAVRLANDSEYGLSASVWSRDRRVATKVAELLEVGTVDVNDAATHILCHPIPQAGWKASGAGHRLGGRAGILKYTRPQSITTSWVDTAAVAKLAGFPYAETKSRLLSATGRLTDGGSLRRRLGLSLSSND